MDDLRLNTKEVLALTPIPRSKLDSWNFRGLVVPVEPSRGQGYPSRYSTGNVVQFELILCLSDSGGAAMALKRAAAVAKDVVVPLSDTILTDDNVGIAVSFINEIESVPVFPAASVSRK